MIALLRLQDMVPQTRVRELKAIMDRESAASGLQRKQLTLVRKWFEDGDVPFVELIQWSRGTMNTTAGESYITMLGGIVVSIHCAACDVAYSRLGSNLPAGAAW